MSVIARTTTRDGVPVEIIHVAPVSAAWLGGLRIAGITKVAFGRELEVRLWTIEGRRGPWPTAETGDDLVILLDWDLDAMAALVAEPPFRGASLFEAAYGYDRSKWPPADTIRDELRNGTSPLLDRPAALWTPKKPPAPSVTERRQPTLDTPVPPITTPLSDGDRTLGGVKALTLEGARSGFDDAMAEVGVMQIAGHRAAGRREALGELAAKVLAQMEGADDQAWEVDPSDVLILRAALEEGGLIRRPDPAPVPEPNLAQQPTLGPGQAAAQNLTRWP